MDDSKRPLIFDNDRITRPYIGGTLMNAWRRMEPSSDGHQCEEELVTSIGTISKGHGEGYAVSRTIPEQGSRLLTDIIKENPEGVLGSKYHKLNPNHLSVLARAGDTIVRLVLQCHPKKADAKRYFNELSGKTEAWYIARTRDVEGEINCVYAGFKEGVTPEKWRGLIHEQNIDEMVRCLHKIPVKEGDVVLIPAGMPHAVGPGCIFLEVHECSDVTIRVERNINGMILTDKEMYNGLSEDVGLTLFDYTTYSVETIAKRCIMHEQVIEKQGNSTISKVITSENTDAFGMNILNIDNILHLPDFDGHRVLIPTDNDLILKCEEGEYVLTQGWGCLLPANLKNLIITTKDGKKGKAVLGLPKVC